ncbi:nucleoside triphosphate pyrophosphohydrolase [Methylobacterium planeticum]|uniref:Nucleoside triphosphate pyrophosphohydrolase n=1 Tax=Methylobacterium planeticum TaxID=2615211 RepID=A0A6N6MJ62_9HYPH|nr:nucleoside triphosphate pyrophosphohydrolase [Methylobacterium planeticum]KAB1070497.1 nucleoside triphosphate pyrophosphohydrolase [Methylobacterium planeticum]
MVSPPSDPPIETLLRLMAQLRDPDSGCAWDVAQTFASIVPYTLEEAYEVADAIERGDMADLKDELGDLLLQVVFHARMAEETGAFGFDAVARTISEKLIRRHPHVFDASGRPLDDAKRPRDPAEIKALWETIKRNERSARAAQRGEGPVEPLAGIAQALPALSRAEKVSRKAASYGFDWPNAREVIAKVREETDEVAEALQGDDPTAVAEEIGDLLFSVANLARHAGVDPEIALRRGTAKFERRFSAMADRLRADGGDLAGSGLADMEAAWAAVKRDERAT